MRNNSIIRNLTHVSIALGSSSETVIHLINKSNSTPKLNDEDASSEKSYKNKHLSSTVVTMLSSQDSGINLSFQDQEDIARRSSSESTKSKQLQDKIDENSESTTENKAKVTSQNERKLEVLRNSKRISMPKVIWQNTVEVIQEFEMIRNGDKVMVCLSGGKDSLILLHALLQYQSFVQNKGIVFTVGAITVDPEASGCDPCVLMTHLKSLGVHYIVDDQNVSDNSPELKENYYSFGSREMRHRLYGAAKNAGYNVLAVGQQLDDVCENFLLSIFHTGKLRALHAHYFLKEHNLRVIRPFIYVRERTLRQFIINTDLPAALNTTVCQEISKQRQRARQLLAQHEILFPKLFNSLKNSLYDLITFQNEEECRKRKKLKAKDSEDSSDNETDEEPILKSD